MTIVATARVPGITSLDQDDTNPIPRPPQPTTVAARPCPPWCADHVDSLTHPLDIDPGAAHHCGVKHTITVLDGYPGRETEFGIHLYLQQYDAAPGRTDEPAHVYLSTEADGKLNAAGLRELAAAALHLAAQLDSDGVPAAPTALSIEDARLVGYAEALRHIASREEEGLVDPAGLRSAADLIDRIVAGPFGAGQPGGAV